MVAEGVMDQFNMCNITDLGQTKDANSTALITSLVCSGRDDVLIKVMNDTTFSSSCN